MKKKSKDFDPLGFTLEHGALQMGTLGVTSMVHRMPSSPSSNRITGGMEHISLIPRVHAVGGVFSSLDSLGKKVKKK